MDTEVEFLKDPLQEFISRMSLAAPVALGSDLCGVPITMPENGESRRCTRAADPSVRSAIEVDRMPRGPGPVPITLVNRSHRAILLIRGEQHELNGVLWSIRRTEIIPPRAAASVLVAAVRAQPRESRETHRLSIPRLVAEHVRGMSPTPGLCGLAAFVGGAFAGLLCVRSPSLADRELPMLLSEHVSDGPAPRARIAANHPLGMIRAVFDLVEYATCEARRLRDRVGHVDFHAEGLDGHLVSFDGDVVTLSIAPREVGRIA